MNNVPFKELRKFTRLDWYYPVEFTIVTLQESIPGIGWKGGFTRNVSAEGICIEGVDIPESTINYLIKEAVCMTLRINVPPTMMPTKAVGEVMWYHKDQEGRYSLGLKFRSIANKDLQNILKHAYWKKSFRQIALYFFLFLVCFGAFLYFK